MSFHVPEQARVRQGEYGSTKTDGNNGAFMLASPIPGREIAIIASDGLGWEHVSVHCYQRRGKRQWTPTWEEMCWVKSLFWDSEDVVLQFHPRESEYVNLHPHTLHPWRPIGIEIPTPDQSLV